MRKGNRLKRKEGKRMALMLKSHSTVSRHVSTGAISGLATEDHVGLLAGITFCVSVDMFIGGPIGASPFDEGS